MIGDHFWNLMNVCHYLLIRVWFQWPQTPPGIWTGGTNCSPNTSSLLIVPVSSLFGGQLSTAESCRDPDVFSARPGVGSQTIAPRARTHAMMGTGLKKARSRFYATRHCEAWVQLSSVHWPLTQLSKCCLGPDRGGAQARLHTFLCTEADGAVMKLLNLPKLLYKSPDWHAELQWAWRSRK